MTNFEIADTDTDMKVFQTADTDADTDMELFQTADTDADMNFLKNCGHGADMPRTRVSTDLCLERSFELFMFRSSGPYTLILLDRFLRFRSL